MKVYILFFFTLLAVYGVVRVLFVPYYRKQRIQRRMDVCPTLLLPPLPKEMDTLRTVASRRIINRSYKVNLYQFTCSCRRFKKFRGLYPQGDIRRLCRHLRREFRENHNLALFEPLIQCIILNRVRDRCYRRFTLLNTDMAFGFHPKSDFVRVYTRAMKPEDGEDGPFSGPYGKYVFNINQMDWVYGVAPPGAERVIIPTILTLFPKERIAALQHKIPTR